MPLSFQCTGSGCPQNKCLDNIVSVVYISSLCHFFLPMMVSCKLQTEIILTQVLNLGPTSEQPEVKLLPLLIPVRKKQWLRIKHLSQLFLLLINFKLPCSLYIVILILAFTKDHSGPDILSFVVKTDYWNLLKSDCKHQTWIRLLKRALEETLRDLHSSYSLLLSTE